MTARRTEPHDTPQRPPPRGAAEREHARRPGNGYDLKVARRHMIDIPDGICMQCFNMQQQFTFPFLVYCEHKRMLAVMRSAHEHATFECAPNQLQAVIAKLGETGLGADTESPKQPPN